MNIKEMHEKMHDTMNEESFKSNQNLIRKLVIVLDGTSIIQVVPVLTTLLVHALMETDSDPQDYIRYFKDVMANANEMMPVYVDGELH